MANELERVRQAQQTAAQLAEAWLAQSCKARLLKDAEIQHLKSRADAGEVTRRLAVSEAVTVVALER